MKRRMFKNWPEMSPVKGGHRVEGTCLMALPWLWTKRTIRFTLGALGVWVMAAVTVPYWGFYLSQDTSWDRVFRWLHDVIEAQIVSGLQDRWELSAPMLSGVCFLVGLQLFTWNKGLAGILTPLAVTLLYPVLMTRMCLQIEHDVVRVARWWGTQKIRRTGKPIVFRCVDPEEYYDKRYLPELPEAGFSPRKAPRRPVMKENGPTIVELLVDRQRYRLFTTRREDVAEAIVFACQAACMKGELEDGPTAPVAAGKLSFER